MSGPRYLLDARCESCGRGLGVHVSEREYREKLRVREGETVQWVRCRGCGYRVRVLAAAYHRAHLRNGGRP